MHPSSVRLYENNEETETETEQLGDQNTSAAPCHCDVLLPVATRWRRAPRRLPVLVLKFQQQVSRFLVAQHVGVDTVVGNVNRSEKEKKRKAEKSEYLSVIYPD